VNPFDLPGPEFLRFHAWLCGGAIAAVVLWRQVGERASLPKLSALDAYSVAYLRGGAAEAMRVVTLALIDRQLIHADGKSLRALPDGWQRVRRPFERAVLKHFAAQSEPSTLFASEAVRASAASLDLELAEAGLLPSAQQRLLRVMLERGAVLVVAGVAAFKILLAASRGHKNVGFLFLLMLFTVVALSLLARGRRTVTGNRALADLRALCEGLKERSAELQIGRGSYDLAMLMGVFGLGALSGPSEDLAKQLFPGAYRRDGSASDGSSGGSCSTASCSSSSGCSSSSCGSSSCGSSCGGGCGGCGGGD
jgi:uncharacterized protein (TIGR04222 family)